MALCFIPIFDHNFIYLPFYYHFYAYFLTLVAFAMLSKASSDTTLSTSFDVKCKIMYSIALSVCFTAIPFYWGVIYEEELSQTYNYRLWITPICANAIPIVFIFFEFLMNAIQFDTSYWYVPTLISVLYLGLDCWRTLYIGENLVRVFTWRDQSTLFIAILFALMQMFIFIVFSVISENKTTSGTSRWI